MCQDDRRRLASGAFELGIQLSGEQAAQFERYAELLEEWNKKLNLTRVPPGQYVTLHFLDSLAPAKVVSFEERRRLIDVGTGAGLPGIPLKIAFPDLEVTLLD